MCRVLLVVSVVWASLYLAHAADGGDLADAITEETLVGHLESLQRIANGAQGTRAFGSDGYMQSVDYVTKTLSATTNGWYTVQRQTFTLPLAKYVQQPVLQQLQPSQRDFTLVTQFDGLSPSMGSGNFEATVTVLTGLGCEPQDYAKFPAGNIVLVKRGACSFGDKVRLAEQHKARALLMYNHGVNGSVAPFRGRIGQTQIPVFSLSFGVGTTLAAEPSPVTLRLSVTTEHSMVNTVNIIADAPVGDSDNVVLVGAHLDSVPAGPGINDNGSGSSTVLTIAAAYHDAVRKGFVPSRRLRVCWWAAEELGLLGSKHYIKTLPESEFAKLAVAINFDMLGSPNFRRGVFDGSALEAPLKRAASTVTRLFAEYYTAQGIAYELIPFMGNSDYAPFIAAGLPAGGLATGAGGIKTMEGRSRYGGLANAPYDTCYHRPCDTLDNVNRKVLLQEARAAAHVIQLLTSGTVPLEAEEVPEEPQTREENDHSDAGTGALQPQPATAARGARLSRARAAGQAAEQKWEFAGPLLVR